MKDSKYEEALERAKELHEAGNALTKSQMEIVFPELKESEDERIRKEMIEYFHGCIQRNKKSGFRVEQIKGWIAYLENLKEYLDDIRQYAYNKGLVDAKQKPAEWSDSVAKEMFIKALERAVEQTKKGYELTDCDKHSWWEDFKAYSGISLTEWSEEDESILRLIHEALSCAYSVKNMDAQTCSVMREWLNNRVKSLRPQPRWKPSEEQVSILGKVFAGCKLNTSERDSMVDLFYHLKDMI